MNTYAIVLAAGKGERFGGPKQFVKVDGKEIVQYTLESVAPWVDGIVLVMPPGRKANDYMMPETDVFFTEGGATRFDSMKTGFALVPEGVNVMVVDAVRCNTHENVFSNLVKLIGNVDVAFPMLPSVSTMCKMGNSTGQLEIFNKTHNHLLEIQTPEIVRYDVLKEAFWKCGPDDGFSAIYMVATTNPKARVTGFPGPVDNFKITYMHDLMLFSMIVEMRKAARNYKPKEK